MPYEPTTDPEAGAGILDGRDVPGAPVPPIGGGTDAIHLAIHPKRLVP